MNTQEAQSAIYHHLIDKYWHGATPDCQAHLSALNFLTSLSLSNADEILQKKNNDYKSYIQSTIDYGNPY